MHVYTQTDPSSGGYHCWHRLLIVCELLKCQAPRWARKSEIKPQPQLAARPAIKRPRGGRESFYLSDSRDGVWYRTPFSVPCQTFEEQCKERWTALDIPGKSK